MPISRQAAAGFSLSFLWACGGGQKKIKKIQIKCMVFLTTFCESKCSITHKFAASLSGAHMWACVCVIQRKHNVHLKRDEKPEQKHDMFMCIYYSHTHARQHT